VVVGFVKENNGKDEFAVVVVVVAIVVGVAVSVAVAIVVGVDVVVVVAAVVVAGGGRNWNEGIIDWAELLVLFVIKSSVGRIDDDDDDVSVLFLSNK
jgi:hypothetical protein